MKTTTIALLLFFSFLFSVRAQELKETIPTHWPAGFKENKGQVSDQDGRPRQDILFTGSSEGMNFYLRGNGISYQLYRTDAWEERASFFKERMLPQLEGKRLLPAQTTVYRLDVQWPGANPQADIVKGRSAPGCENYYLASCPQGATGVKNYETITYTDIYPGIDLQWYKKDGHLKYDYLVSAYADLKKIKLQYEGADKLYVNRSGELVIETPLGSIKEQKPLVMQDGRPLNARWAVSGNTVSFEVDQANPSLPLTIDPMIRLWGTYYGGAGNDDAFYTHIDASGNVYLSGTTSSAANIATSGVHQTTFAGPNAQVQDAYVAKFTSAGVRIWATYYGGTGDDFGSEAVTDAAGNVFMTGGTMSSTMGVIATPGAHQTVYSNASTNQGDAFLVVFNASGIRQWGTYYGGERLDAGYGVSVDNSGNIFIAGVTQSTMGIGTPGSHQPSLTTPLMQGFLAKFNAAGVRQWGTYYCGIGGLNDCINNSTGDVYISGVTSATTGIATLGCHQPVYGGGPSNGNGDGVFAKFSTSGALLWGTYYGGSNSDGAATISLDASGNLYGVGYGASSASGTAIATAGAHQPAYGGGPNDAFLVKFDAFGVRQWATYYGGISGDAAWGCSVDGAGNIYIAGQTATNSGTAIATTCAYSHLYAGGSTDLYLAKFTPAGTRIWGSYYGSVYTDAGSSCAADAAGNVYLCGFTLANSGTVIASTNGHQPVYGGGPADAILAKFDGCVPGAAINTTHPSNLLVCTGTSATLSATCGNWYADATGNTVLGTGATFTSGALTNDTTFYVEDFGCSAIVGPRTAIHVTIVPVPQLTVTNSNPAACVGDLITITASGASTYTWSAPVTSVSPSFQVYVLLNAGFTVTGADANGCVSTASIAVVPVLCTGLEEQSGAKWVSVYPNPGNGIFTIQSDAALHLSLTNELGQTLSTIHLSEENAYKATLDGLPGGIYFLKGDAKHPSFYSKIVVLH